MDRTIIRSVPSLLRRLRRPPAAQPRPLRADLGADELVADEESHLGARVRGLLLELEGVDPSTGPHSRRVALLAVQVGEQLKLPPATLRHLAVAGLVHDLGKLAVPPRILLKPGALDRAEFGEIEKHPRAGTDLLRELGGFSDEVHRFVAEHHERLDGSGYPHGLIGLQLGIGPRGLAVCDVYDALISDRVYRDAWTAEEALALLREQAGPVFDAKCVHALEQVVRGAPAPLAFKRVRIPASG